ncbi:MAG: FRG domain-containing protein [Bryobacter sp.]|nr:FRG domain-containing protein [Bryobacter sp.]
MSENPQISWTNLQEKLRASPSFQAIDSIRGQLTDEQYSFAAAAILFLDKHDTEDFEAENYPDIYELVWELKGTSSKLFRGQRDARWPLDPTLLRRSPQQPLTFSEFSDRIRKTEEFVDYLRKHSEDYFHGAPSDMDLLAIAQHYGFSTQLLDFTESVEVAAFFATLQHDPKKTSKSSLGVIYSLPQDYDSRSDNIEDINIAESLSLKRGRPIVVSPPLHEKEHRIKRQKAKFIAGHRGIDLYSAGLTPHVFRQIPGSIYEDAAKNISKDYLLEEDSELYKVAQCILRSRPAKSPASQLFGDITIRASALMTTLSQSSEPLIDRAQTLWTDIFDQLRTEYENDFAGRAKSILSEYFKLLQQRAESGFSIPIGKPYLTLRPLNASIGDIESHFDLPDGTIHALCGKHLVTVDSEAGFQLNREIEAWPTKARVGVAFGLLVKGIDQLQAGFELECNSTLRAGHFIMRSNLNRE